MQKLFYYQLNTTDIKRECKKLEIIHQNEFLIIGIEITRKEFKKYCDILIDPQHNMNRNITKLTSVEYIYNNYQDLIDKMKNYKKVMMVTVKTDIDSIASMALLTMTNDDTFKLDGDIVLRLIAIAKSDKHGRENWKNRKNDNFNFDNYNIYGLPYGVQYMCSDYKLKTVTKVKKIIEYLKTGSFDDLTKYNLLVGKNLKKSIKDTTSEIIIPEKLSFVTSRYRGATSKGYQDSPVVIAQNPLFSFGKGNTKLKGTKYTIAQYDEGYVNLNNVLNDILELEEDWGGSSVIIGSPQDKPSKLKKNQLIKIVKNHII
jgi:hypothetical protein